MLDYGDWREYCELNTQRRYRHMGMSTWRATCGVDETHWTVESEENPAPYGSFCPACRARGSVGVLHWKGPADTPETRMRAAIEDVRSHVDAWVSLLAEYVSTLPPDTQPTSEDSAGLSDRSYAEHELRAMNRDLAALIKSVQP